MTVSKGLDASVQCNVAYLVSDRIYNEAEKNEY